MLAAVFRRVLLSYASQFFTNVEVENLSLWSGLLAIENVDINAKEVTAFLGLPGIRMVSGSLGRIEMQVPWSALTSSSLEVSLKEVSIELELGKYQPEVRVPEPTPEAEESLVRKVLANVKVKVERLSVVLRFRGEAQYCLKLLVSNINFGTTDRDWEYQFVNPFSLTDGGTAYKHFRLLQVQDLEVRAISGDLDDYLSNTVLGHRFESRDCKSCALCYAFKSSSFYTLLALKPCALDIYWYVASEKSQLLKPGLLSYSNTTETWSMDIRLTTPVQAKCCLAEEQKLVKDLALLTSALTPEAQSPVTCTTEPGKDDQSWFTWGKEILFPIYCATPVKQQSKMVRVSTFFLTVTVPQVQWQVKLFNSASLEPSRVKLFATDFTSKRSVRRTETTDPDYAPVENRDEMEGGSREFLLYVYLKNNYSVVRMACLRFALKDGEVAFSGSDADMQVAIRGKTSKAVVTKLLEGKITCGAEVTAQTNLEQMHLQFTPEEIITFIEAMMELNCLYQRLCAPVPQPFPALETLLASRVSQTSTEDKLLQAEQSIAQLKAALLATHAQLQTAKEEASRLRSVLSNTVGGSVPALAGMLSIDQSSIKAVCPEAVYNTFPAKAVLTSSDLIILSQEGRQMNRIQIAKMVRLEERGEEELQVHTDSAAVRMTLRYFLLRNRSEFVRGIQEVCGN